MADISNREDILDVRDIIERVEELREERGDLQLALQEANDEDSLNDCIVAKKDLEDWLAGEGEELKQLEDLLSDLQGSGGDHEWEGDWYPVTLIRDSYFEDAMRELVQDIGDLPKDIPSYLVIDWEKTAENLQQDYSSVDYDGVTYWYR